MAITSLRRCGPTICPTSSHPREPRTVASRHSHETQAAQINRPDVALVLSHPINNPHPPKNPVHIPIRPNRLTARNVIIGYRHNASQVARQVRYYSRAEPTLKVAPQKLTDHHRVHLWGQVPGSDPVGRVVVLQANVPGSKRWITIRQTTTGAEGPFKSSYRFFATTRATTYRFQALVPTQAGYPWVEGASPAARVRVKG